MGEAKRRKACEPDFGKPKAPRRGLVVCPPLEIKGSRLYIGSSNLDPQELRCALLLFDDLVWPSSRTILLASGPDEQFLERVGVLTRPDYTFNGDAVHALAKAQSQAFIDLDARDSGRWSLAQGKNSLLLHEQLLVRDAGALLELQRAIPVPDRDVPLNEVLEFKQRRHDELQRLRDELDGFLAAINHADDKAAELRKHVTIIDSACTDALKVSREWQFPVRLANYKVSFDLRPFVPLIAGVTAYHVSELASSSAILAGIGGALGAAGSVLKLTGDFGWRGLKRRLGPYRYVYQFHKELF